MNYGRNIATTPSVLECEFLENHDSIFYNVPQALLDLNLQTQYHTLFTLGIQTSWQLQIMQKIGHGSLVFFDTTFGMPFFLLYEMPQN
jgi:hypothetical protein